MLQCRAHKSQGCLSDKPAVIQTQEELASFCLWCSTDPKGQHRGHFHPVPSAPSGICPSPSIYEIWWPAGRGIGEPKESHLHPPKSSHSLKKSSAVHTERRVHPCSSEEELTSSFWKSLMDANKAAILKAQAIVTGIAQHSLRAELTAFRGSQALHYTSGPVLVS